MLIHSLVFISILSGTVNWSDKVTPIQIDTDYGESPSNISTDELVIKFSDGSSSFLTKNTNMERCPALDWQDSSISFLRRSDSNEDGKVNWLDSVELWQMKLSDKSETRLVAGLIEPSQPTWSPLEMKVAFLANNREGVRSLYTYSLNDQHLERLTDNASSWPTWSIDGNYIAYYNDKNEVTVYGIQNKEKRIISPDVGNGWALYWLYDNRLIFTQENQGFSVYNPHTKTKRPFNILEHMIVKTVHQEKFGWAKHRQRNINVY